MKWLNLLLGSAVMLGVAVVILQLAEAQTPQQVAVDAQTFYRPLEADRGASALWQSLLKLHTRASMIMIDAHPDDEDGGTAGLRVARPGRPR